MWGNYEEKIDFFFLRKNGLVFRPFSLKQTFLKLNKHTNAEKQEHLLAETELCNHYSNNVFK